MGILSKEAYEGKKNFAANKAHSNIEIAMENGATEEQAKAIARLCADRHFLHSNWKSIFNDESDESDKASKMMTSIYEEDSINIYLANAGLNAIDLLNNFADDIPTSCTYELYDLSYDEAYNQFCDYMGELDNVIIEYLIDFDKKYLTNFAPTLNARYADIGGLH